MGTDPRDWQEGGCLSPPRSDGATFASSGPGLSSLLAKIAAAEEEQEDPYLNDRCRGETPGPRSPRWESNAGAWSQEGTAEEAQV